MHRYLITARLERSPEVVSALSAASMTVLEPNSRAEPATTELELERPRSRESVVRFLDVLVPPPDGHTTRVVVNATSEQEAIAGVRDALRQWGEIVVEVDGGGAAVGKRQGRAIEPYHYDPAK